MSREETNRHRKIKEFLYQIVVHMLVFTVYAFTRNHPEITGFELASFANYTIIAFFINYFVLPRYYKNRRVFELILLSVLSLFICILIEEGILEPIFFPENRGADIRLFWTIVGVLPKLSLLVVFKMVWDMIYMRKELDELKSLAEQNELQFLQTQINPHFLFNNLNNIYSYSLEGSPKTPKIILGLADMMRYVLYECKEDYMPLSKEVTQLKNFIELNELQLEGRGEVKVEVIGDASRYKVAPLIFIVFVENAFKHSASSLSDGIKINIVLEITNNGELLFTCENNFSEKTSTDSLSKGIGLTNVYKRLKLIYGDQYNLQLDDSNSNYVVKLLLPLKK